MRSRLACDPNECRTPRTGNVRSTVQRLQHRHAEDGGVNDPNLGSMLVNNLVGINPPL